ncbi:MAG: serine hydrolase [Pseudomonadales bacterium]
MTIKFAAGAGLAGWLLLAVPGIGIAADAVWPHPDWIVATTQGEGVDVEPLLDFDRALAAGEHGYVDGLLVIRQGKVVFERSYRHDYAALFERQDQTRGPYNYYDPAWHPYYRETDLHTMQSVSKSVTSALIGIAIGRGEIPGVDVAVERYFPDHPAADDDPRRRSMTLRDLLTMTSGIAWDESSVPYTDPRNDCAQMEASEDWIRYVRGRPMAAEPGVSFRYNSGVTMLLAHILHQASGLHVTEYAERHLFRPLGIDEYYWKITPTGLPDAEGGLYLRPRDLAKIGYLYLHDGVWERQRVLPEGWVGDSTAPRVDSSVDGWKYGYQWWLLPYDGGYAYTGLGYGGQRLLVLPDHDVVAVATGWNIYDKPQLSAALVLDRVLAAVR